MRISIKVDLTRFIYTTLQSPSLHMVHRVESKQFFIDISSLEIEVGEPKGSSFVHR